MENRELKQLKNEYIEILKEVKKNISDINKMLDNHLIRCTKNNLYTDYIEYNIKMYNHFSDEGMEKYYMICEDSGMLSQLYNEFSYIFDDLLNYQDYKYRNKSKIWQSGSGGGYLSIYLTHLYMVDELDELTANEFEKIEDISELEYITINLDNYSYEILEIKEIITEFLQFCDDYVESCKNIISNIKIVEEIEQVEIKNYYLSWEV